MGTSRVTEFSVVVPVYNSERSVAALVAGLVAYFERRGSTFEVVLVDDGSRDGSLAVIKGLAAADTRVKVLSFYRNFGQISALMAGLNHAVGQFVVIMDDDLQHSPEDIEKLHAKMLEGFDVVYAISDRRVTSLWRSFGSGINDRMAQRLIGKPRDIELSSFLMARDHVVREIVAYKGPYPYIAGLLFRISGSVGNVRVRFNERRYGSSNYSLMKLALLWINGFTNFSIAPLRALILFGCACSLLGFLCTLVIIWNKIFRVDYAMGWTSIESSIFFFGGVQLVALGAVGEYVGRIFMVVNGQPQYVIREKVNVSPALPPPAPDVLRRLGPHGEEQVEDRHRRVEAP